MKGLGRPGGGQSGNWTQVSGMEVGDSTTAPHYLHKTTFWQLVDNRLFCVYKKLMQETLYRPMKFLQYADMMRKVASEEAQKSQNLLYLVSPLKSSTCH